MKNQDLYNEEQRQILLDTQKTIGELKGLFEKQLENYVAPKDEVVVSGQVQVNTEKEIEVSNLKDVVLALNDLADTFTTTIQNNSYKPLDEVKIKNLPNSFEIKNLNDLAKYFTTLTKAIEDSKSIVNVTKQEVVFPTSPNKAIPVRLSDGRAFYNAITTAMSSGGLSKLAQSNLESLKFNDEGRLEVDANFSGDIDIGDVQVKNLAGSKIDPSTEQKQDTQIATLESILAELLQKTEASQNQQVEVINAMRVLMNAVANPSYVDKSANQMRSQVTGSLTTVTTVTNLTNIGSYPANHLQVMDNMTAWATNVRQIIT